MPIDATSSDPITASALSTVPQETPLQLNGGLITDPKNSVNLFRGEVNLPVQLFSIKGHGGLNIDVSIFYQSDIEEDFKTWNLTAPTGVLGLGWSMPFDQIIKDIREDTYPSNDVYYLVTSGTPNRLRQISSQENYYSYQLENYEFWEVSYYFKEQFWKVIREDGTSYYYGTSPDAQQYEIYWGAWTGPSIVTTHQKQLPIAWSLDKITNIWGNSTYYNYEPFSDDLIPIGPHGKTYRRASYIRSIYNDSGKTVTFLYADKTNNSSIQEYQIPHINPNSSSVQAYQDRYETRFLKEIIVTQQEEEQEEPYTALKIGFDYDVKNYSDDPKNPGLFKRYLTGIKMRNNQNNGLPGMNFSYYEGNEPSNIAKELRGKLKTVIQPEGGSVTYNYEKVTLSNTDLSLEVDESITGVGVPRIWFGPDYVVILRYDRNRTRRLVVSVYSWNSNWVGTRVFEQDIQGELDLESIQVTLQSDFFALGYKNTPPAGSLEMVMLAFHKKFGQYGRWDVQTLKPLSIAHNDDEIQLNAGADFLVGVVSNTQEIRRVIWNPLTKQWDDSSERLSENGSYSLDAHQDFYVLSTYNNSSRTASITLTYLDEIEKTWHTISLDTIRPIVSSGGFAPLFWSIGNTFAVATFITSIDESSGTFRYQVVRYQWDKNFQPLRPSYLNPDPLPLDTRLPFYATLTQNNMIGNLGDVFRYNGESWSYQRILFNKGASTPPRFAYGDDIAIVNEVDRTDAYIFNAYQDSWTPISSIFPSHTGEALIQPTITGNYFTVQDNIYQVSPTGDLSIVGKLAANVAPNSIANRAPYYIASANSEGRTEVLYIENGKVKSFSSPLNGYLFTNKQGAPGTDLAGPRFFVTFDTPDFDEARRLTLHNVLWERIDGPAYDTRVSSIVTNDGIDTRYTSYNYEGDATTGPFGLATQYTRVRLIDGSQDVNKRPFGSTLYEFYNGRVIPHLSENQSSSVEFYTLLNGYILANSNYDASGKLVSYSIHDWNVNTTRQNLYLGKEEPLYGAYIREQGQTHVIECDVISLESSSRSLLENGQALTPLLSYLKKIKQSPKKKLKPRELAFDSVWSLTDPHNQRRYPIVKLHDHLVAVVGLENTVENSYNPGNGMLASQTIRNYNDRGQRETLVSRNIYAWEIYPQLLESHQISEVIENMGLVNDEIIKRNLTVWTKEWKNLKGEAVWALKRSYQARSSKAVFSLKEWNDKSLPSPDDWLLVTNIISRDTAGNLLESTNAEGIYSSVLYDKNQLYIVAQYENARAVTAHAEAIYYGFEPYEDSTGWVLAKGSLDTAVVLGDAHTGSRSLRLVPENTLTRKLTPQKLWQPFLLSCWVKTEKEFESDAGEAYWTVVLEDQSGHSKEVIIPLTSTESTWTYCSAVIDVPKLWDGLSDSGPSQLALKVYNKKQRKWLQLDEIKLSPLLCSAKIRVYDNESMLPTATLNENGGVSRFVYDQFKRGVSEIGLSENVNSLATVYIGRQDLLKNEVPINFSLAITAQHGGIYERFGDGEQWRDRWIFKGNKWAVRHQSLIHTSSSTEESISYIPSQDLGSYSFRIRAIPSILEEPQHPLGFRIGSDLKMMWDPKSGWSMEFHGAQIPRAATGNNAHKFNQEWVLLVTETSLSFYADGAQLFTTRISHPLQGILTLFARDSIAFKDVILLKGAEIRASYSDGFVQERQLQTVDGESRIVSATYYDPLGRAAVKTKPMRYLTPLLSYESKFIKSFDWVSGVMTGDIADYYNGKDGHSNDQGYPYSRAVFEPSPLARVIKEGMPGKNFAIILSKDGQDLNKHITSTEYGTNGATGLFNELPAQQYLVTKKTDPDGVGAIILSSKRGQALIYHMGINNISNDPTIVSKFLYDNSGQLIHVASNQYSFGNKLPQGHGAENSLSYDFLGRVISRVTVDTQNTKYAYDLSSRLRFSVDQAGLNQTPNVIEYTKYDALGRVVEGGIVHYEWGDGSELKNIAETQPNWPNAESGVYYRWIRRIKYDRYNPDLNTPYISSFGIGLLAEAQTQNDEAKTIVSDKLTYNRFNQVIKVVTETTGTYTHSDTLQYHYNNSGEITDIIYPDGWHLHYVFNALAQVVSIQDGTDHREIVSYSYDPNGLIAEKVYNSTLPSITAAYQYNSPGWITRASYLRDNDLLWEESLLYANDTQAISQKFGSYTGRINKASYKFGSEFRTQNYSYSYEYDNFGRLVSAINDTYSDGTIGSILYDPDGNIRELKRGNVIESHEYEENTNKVIKILDENGKVINTLKYDAKGDISENSQKNIKNIKYQTGTNLTIGLNVGEGNPISFIYDANNRLSLKVLGSGSDAAITRFVNGPNGFPIFQSSGTKTKRYIHGPDGFIGMGWKNKLYTFIDDQAQSIRAVLQNDEIVAELNYLPFGEILEKPLGNHEVLSELDYRYKGHYYDSDLDLYNYGSRLYDPRLRRFYSIDNLGQFFNPYLAFANDPINFIDENGDFAFLALLAAALLDGVITGTANAIAHKDSSSRDVWAYFGIGFGVGFAGGALGGGAGMIGAEIGSPILLGGIVGGGVSGAAEGALLQGFNNLKQGQDFGRNITDATWMGAVSGAASGGVLAGGATCLARARIKFNPEVDIHVEKGGRWQKDKIVYFGKEPNPFTKGFEGVSGLHSEEEINLLAKKGNKRAQGVDIQITNRRPRPGTPFETVDLQLKKTTGDVNTVRDKSIFKSGFPAASYSTWARNAAVNSWIANGGKLQRLLPHTGAPAWKGYWQGQTLEWYNGRPLRITFRGHFDESNRVNSYFHKA